MADKTLGQDVELETAEEQGSGAPAAIKKVELDLDDAPFLQTEEKAPPPANLDEQLDADEDAKAQGRRRKKLFLILAGAGIGLLLIAGAAIWWFFFRTPPPLPPDAPKPEIVVVPSQAAPAENPEIVRAFAPFVTPVKDAAGQTRFLVCKFSAITDNPAVNQEMAQQMTPLRDAIYYYLRSKDESFLLDARNGEEIKKDLLSVFNDYLTQGKLEDIVFESYLGK